MRNKVDVVSLPEELDASKHSYALRTKREGELIVRLDWKHHGFGGEVAGQKFRENMLCILNNLRLRFCLRRTSDFYESF